MTKFDFKHEALTAAVNEACAGDDEKCTMQDPCRFCLALAVSIEARLKRAFIAGQQSLEATGD